MAEHIPSMTFDGMHAFVQKIAQAIMDLRSALEANDMERLPAAIDLTNILVV
jgi:hypothetical protein